MENSYLTCSEIAEITGRSIVTVWSWCRTGKLKASRPGGRDYLIKTEDLEAFLAGDDRKKEA